MPAGPRTEAFPGVQACEKEGIFPLAPVLIELMQLVGHNADVISSS